MGNTVSELVSPFQFATCKLFFMEAKKPSANPLAMGFLSCLGRNSGLSMNSDISGRGRFLLVLVLGTCSLCWASKGENYGLWVVGSNRSQLWEGKQERLTARAESYWLLLNCFREQIPVEGDGRR